MLNKLYRKQANKKPIAGMLLAGLVLALAAGIIGFIVPDNGIVEVLAILLVWIGLFVLFAWATGKKKWGWAAALVVVGTLVMNRIEVLDWITFILLLVLTGLISLLN